MFDKKKETQPAQQEQAPMPAGTQPVYTMPEQYMPPKNAAKSNSGAGGAKMWMLIIGIGFALFIILVAIGVFVLQSMQQQAPAVTAPTTQEVTGVTNAANDNTNVANVNTTNSGLSLNLNADTELQEDVEDNLFNDNTNTRSNTNNSNNANSRSNTNVATAFIDRSSVTPARDKDTDGLTDEEEELYGTTFSAPDTDRDGFTDGREVEEGFSPAVEGETLLEDGLTLEYKNTEYGWTMQYPTPWLASSLDATNTDVLFTSDAVDGELVEVVVTQNPTGQTAAQWFASLYTDVDAEDLDAATVGGLKGIVSPDGFQYHVAGEDVIISISYNFGTLEQIHFQTTFAMMLNSFEYTAPEPETIDTTNTNSTSNTNSSNTNVANTNAGNTNTGNTNTTNTNATTNTNSSNSSNTNSANTNTGNTNNTNS